MRVISRKAYRFNHPKIKLLDALTEEHAKGTLPPEKRAFVEVRGGSAPGAYGEPVDLPDWAAEDGMFKAALANRNLVVLPEDAPVPEEKVIRTVTDDASIAATLAAAQRGPLVAGAPSLGGESTDASKAPAEVPVDLNGLTKAQLVDHAAEVHGVELDPKLTRPELIAAIEKEQRGGQ
jgi:hypothetical protein